MSERKGLLPIVEEETCINTKNELIKAIDIFDIIIEKIGGENPLIINFLAGYGREIKEPVPMYCNGIFVYKTLDKTDLLPIVKRDIGKMVIEEMSQDKSYYARNFIKRLEEDNPSLVKHILINSEKTKEPMYTAYGGLMVYRLLEKQIELDILKNSSISYDKEKYPKTYELRKSLNLAIITEQYELATKFRDEINATSEPL